MVLIFIVDDEENLHQIYRALFAMRGHKVIGSAFDGIEAIKRLSELNPKPDVIIMDHRMPRMDGITATKKIMKMDKRSKIVFVSADETVQNEAMTAGAAIFKVKPVRAHQLFKTITQLTHPS